MHLAKSCCFVADAPSDAHMSIARKLPLACLFLLWSCCPIVLTVILFDFVWRAPLFLKLLALLIPLGNAGSGLTAKRDLLKHCCQRALRASEMSNTSCMRTEAQTFAREACAV